MAYRKTSVFDAESLPAGLRHEHNTKMGVWGRVHVLEGALRFRRLDPYQELELMIGTHDVIRPGEPHEVEPIGPVRFFVEFLKLATADK